MTDEDAQAVARILIEADGNCSDCYLRLFQAAAKRWPAFDWLKMAQATGQLTVAPETFSEAMAEAEA